jgi:hypothetical protein
MMRKRYDLAAYAVPGAEAPPIYDMSALKRDYGFIPTHPVG